MALTDTWKGTAKGRYGISTSASKLELSDYGVVVQVKRPADVVPTTN